jgi:hypothetical protein
MAEDVDLVAVQYAMDSELASPRIAIDRVIVNRLSRNMAALASYQMAEANILLIDAWDKMDWFPFQSSLPWPGEL